MCSLRLHFRAIQFACAAAAALWLRAVRFTLLCPGLAAFLAPWALKGSELSSGRVVERGLGAGCDRSAAFLHCLLRFLAAHGTPAIFFSRPLRFLIGAEPHQLVRGGPYRFARNPMYLGVLGRFGQALLFKSSAIAIYRLCLCGFFERIVVLVEEPHLRARDGLAFGEYSRKTPRWVKLW